MSMNYSLLFLWNYYLEVGLSFGGGEVVGESNERGCLFETSLVLEVIWYMIMKCRKIKE